MSKRQQRLLRFWAWGCTALVIVFSVAAFLSDRYWFAWIGENHQREVFSSRGIGYVRANFERLPPGVIVIVSDGLGPGWYLENHKDVPWHVDWQWRARANFRNSLLSLELPLWIPIVVATLAAASSWWAAFVVRRNSRIGFCPSCRYPTAGLTSPICPECGSAIPPPLPL